MPSWCANGSHSKWVQVSARQKTVKRTWFQQQESEASVPPMVAKARELLALPANDRPSGLQATPIVMLSGLGAPKSSPSSAVEAESQQRFTLEAFKRRRRGAPLEPVSIADRPRAGLKTALVVASSDELVSHATNTFAQLRYAAGTCDTKDSLFRTWAEILRVRNMDPLPVTDEKLELVASILRASGYRAGMAYLLEAKQRHVRRGYPWSEAMDLTIKDCKRVFNRAMGPAKKAEEIRLEWVQAAFEAQGDWTNPEGCYDGPWASLLAWAAGIHFVLREVELATLTLSEDVIKLNLEEAKVTLLLTVSKTDPAGRGARRTLACCNRGNCSASFECPFWVCRQLVAHQEERSGVKQTDPEARDIPLVGTIGNPLAFVEKAKMLEMAKLDAATIVEVTPEAAAVDVEAVTGHFMRRSGCKRLARKGYPVDIIKHLSRHSSSAVEGYIEEALEECPLAATKVTEFQQVNNALCSFRCELDELKKSRGRGVADVRSDELRESLASLEEEVTHMWQELRPALVKNINSKKVHSTAGCSFRGSPLDWSTKCGWRWVTGERSAESCTMPDAKALICCDKCLKLVPSSDALAKVFSIT